MTDDTYLNVEPEILTLAIGEWVNQEILLTNRRSETYHDVIVTLRPPWQIKLKQKEYLIGNLDPGVSKSINLEAKVTGQPDQSFSIQLSIRIDEKLPQKLNLSIRAEKPDELPSLSGETSKPGKFLPSVSDFEHELNKLNTYELEKLCRYEMFNSIYNGLVGADMINSDRVGKIMDYCKRRQKFPELHEALKKILQKEYTFLD